MPIEPQAFIDGLSRQLDVLSFQQQLAFGAICCERHQSDYLAFKTQEHFGNPEALRRGIDAAWARILDEPTSDEQPLTLMLAECVEATPDAEDFETVLVDYAQDAAIMVCHLIKFMETKNTQSIVSLASKARDLVDAKVQFTEQLDPADPALESKIANAQAMQLELEMQQMSLRHISEVGSSRELANLRSR